MLGTWCCEATGQGNLSVIFGRVTPKEVINTGPYALCRHPVSKLKVQIQRANLACLVDKNEAASRTPSR